MHCSGRGQALSVVHLAAKPSGRAMRASTQAPLMVSPVHRPNVQSEPKQDASLVHGARQNPSEAAGPPSGHGPVDGGAQ
jgi:hypothetical protein